MKYKDLKDERDAAVARAVEAERLSMKSEFDRVTAEFEAEKARLIAKHEQDVSDSYENGYNHGFKSAVDRVVEHAQTQLRSFGSGCSVAQQNLFEESNGREVPAR